MGRFQSAGFSDCVHGRGYIKPHWGMAKQLPALSAFTPIVIVRPFYIVFVPEKIEQVNFGHYAEFLI